MVEEQQHVVRPAADVQRCVAGGVRDLQQGGCTPSPQEILERDEVLARDSPVQQCAPAAVDCAQELRVDAQECAQRSRPPEERGESGRCATVVLELHWLCAVQQEQVDQLGVAVHRRVHQCSHALPIGCVQVYPLAEEEPYHGVVTGRDRQAQRRVALGHLRIPVE